ncbi:hypothetical protein GALMADRAFT_215483 [Galerina marginata CBS 339.88]|uniref:Uncharacterized protein n=1 Tax=Galerina marginata (strain CBS 339.88) TaxID=685588 RepID=A0A067SDA7_GALM3|nr:hypothetical protein GALMADRAFT_215483 [Galerina marginata CBS 339.88]
MITCQGLFGRAGPWLSLSQSLSHSHSPLQAAVIFIVAPSAPQPAIVEVVNFECTDFSGVHPEFKGRINLRVIAAVRTERTHYELRCEKRQLVIIGQRRNDISLSTNKTQ